MTTNEPRKDRTAVELIDNHVPYSEMTESEIDSVIQWRADRKAESNEVQARQKAFEESQAQMLSTLERQRSDAEQAFADIVGQVTARALAVEEVLHQYD